MKKLLGIDIGTSSVKTVLINEHLELLYDQKIEYGVEMPELGFAEQDPIHWWECVCQSLKGIPTTYKVNAIGITGQMHGLVAVDRLGRPIRRAIIWSDRRTAKEVKEIQQTLQELNCNDEYGPLDVGMLLPSLLWLKKNEPQLFQQIHKVMLPKDFIRYQLTGIIATEHSDACATGAYSFALANWNESLLKKLGINPALFPPIYHSLELAGYARQDITSSFHVLDGARIIYGGSDHSMQLVGNSVTSPGTLNCNIGSGSQVSLSYDMLLLDPLGRLTTFCHAIPGMYNFVGTSLNGGIVLQWIRNLAGDKVTFEELDQLAADIPIGSDGLTFLPYINGERGAPDKTKGVVHGLTFHHTKGHFIRGAMEGMIYFLRERIEVFKEIGLSFHKVITSGGGTKSPVLLQIQADIFQADIYVCEVKEQGAVGAALMAGVEAKIFPSLAVINKLLEEKIVRVAQPNNLSIEKYNESFKEFKTIQNYYFSTFNGGDVK
ncbi:xylulokinase [Evansella tamaricis]|uniref:Xylulose kinase n=1 Tax=Evansella tamaricis TaxID=2069301 RepID=A0ABS6JA15_9BACI|nr:xylulokinase [Evansella tamaricis]MBU9710521.1 xylulokinase [Evansella tamaricis]